MGSLRCRFYGRSFEALCQQAARDEDGSCALQIALYYAFGIGTVEDLAKSLVWLEKAAVSGNYFAIVFLKRLQVDPVSQRPAATRVILNTDKLFECYLQYENDGDKSSEIETLLRETEYDFWAVRHTLFKGLCWCMKFTPSPAGEIPEQFRSTYEIFQCLRQLSMRFDSLIGDSPASVDPEKLEYFSPPVDSRGYTALHILARCCHPFPDGNGEIFYKNMVETLLRLGVAIDCQGVDGETCLSLAIEQRNLALIDILNAKGAFDPHAEDHGRLASTRHDAPLMERVLIPLSRQLITTDKTPDWWFSTLMEQVCIVHTNERKLMEGWDYEQRGSDTVDILLKFAMSFHIDIDGLSASVEVMLVTSGNCDLYKYLRNRIPRFRNPRSGDLTQDSLFYLAILYRQREFFLLFLEQGQDVNAVASFPDGKIVPDYPVVMAANNFSQDPFFFCEIMNRGADLGLLKDTGAEILRTLIRQENGFKGVELVLSKFPRLSQFVDEDNAHVPMLSFAAGVGFPDTLSLLIKFGAGVNATDASGMSALAVAIVTSLTRKESLMNLRVLLSHEEAIPHDDEKQDRLDGALLAAASVGSLECVELLLGSGANPNYSSNRVFPGSVTAVVTSFKKLVSVLARQQRAWRLQYKLALHTFEGIRDRLTCYGLDMALPVGESEMTTWDYLDNIFQEQWGKKLEFRKADSWDEIYTNLQYVKGRKLLTS